MISIRAMFVLVLVFACVAPAAADTVHLTNGDIVTGEILELDGDEIVLDAALLDVVRIEVEDIRHLETSRPFTIQYHDGSDASGYIVLEDGQMVLRAEPADSAEPDASKGAEAPDADDTAEAEVAAVGGEDVEAEVAAAEATSDDVEAEMPEAAVVGVETAGTEVEADLAAMPDAEAVAATVGDETSAATPDDELTKHEAEVAANVAASDGRVVTLDEIFNLEVVETYYRYEAEIDVGINVSKGNTDQSSFNVSGMIAPSFGKNTVRLGGQLNRTEADGETTASNWRIDASYEREFTRRWRAIALNRYENDKFQDLDLRVTASAGPGYSILLDNPSLEVFLAPAYVHQTFKEDPSRDFAALLWRLDFEYEIPKPDSTFYHNHSLTVGVTESQTVAQTTTGFKWELIGDLDLKLEYQLDWNSKPADNADEFDQRYMLKISYDFEGDERDWFH